jgi:hypothetical protein
MRDRSPGSPPDREDKGMSAAPLPAQQPAAETDTVPTNDEWRVRVVPNLLAAQDLMDHLEACGHTHIEFDLCEPSGFVVRWR